MSKLFEAAKIIKKNPNVAKKIVESFIKEAMDEKPKEKPLTRQQRAFMQSYLKEILASDDLVNLEKKEFINRVSNMDFDDGDTSYPNVIAVAKRMKSLGYFDELDVHEDKLGGKHIYVEMNKKSAVYLWNLLEAHKAANTKSEPEIETPVEKEEIKESVEDLSFRIEDPDDDMIYVIKFDNSDDSSVFQKAETEIASDAETARVVKPYEGEIKGHSVPKGTLNDFYDKSVLSGDDIDEIYERVARYIHPIYDVEMDVEESAEQAMADERPGIVPDRGNKRLKRIHHGSKIPRDHVLK